jgi:hypothetical protein
MSAGVAQIAEWGSFYVIVGSASGALIGLQFVVMTLLAERPPADAAAAGAAFGSPTIVHFGAALLLSALLNAPWRTIAVPAALWGLMGFAGVGYAVIVARRMRRQGAYRPELDDWVFYIALPSAAYAMLALSSLAATSHTSAAMACVGIAALMLLFIGIRNAWDSVTYHVLVSAGKNGPDPRRGRSSVRVR